MCNRVGVGVAQFYNPQVYPSALSGSGNMTERASALIKAGLMMLAIGYQ